MGVAAAGLFLIAVPALPASADPVGPTDYRSEVISVVPPAAGVDIEMIGGDSFLQISAQGDNTVEVIGYRGEPYLRFGPGGTVEINDNAPSTYLNADRYGDTEVPEFASPEADPSWRVVSEDGVFAWHDHRTHWMNAERPAAEPGDQILEAVVPLVVDGVDTDVTVISTWQEPPSSSSVFAGVVIGLLVAVAVSRSGERGPALGLLGLGAVAALVAFAAYRAVPAETAPSVAPGAAALLSAGLAGYGLVRPGRQHTLTGITPAFTLVVWGILRWEWMFRSILPTSIPSVDRFVTGLVLVAAAGTTVTIVFRRFVGLRRVSRHA